MALFAVGKLFRYLLVAGGWTWFLSTIWPWMKVTFGWSGKDSSQPKTVLKFCRKPRSRRGMVAMLELRVA
jgi:hypothetical protein